MHERLVGASRPVRPEALQRDVVVEQPLARLDLGRELKADLRHPAIERHSQQARQLPRRGKLDAPEHGARMIHVEPSDGVVLVADAVLLNGTRGQQQTSRFQTAAGQHQPAAPDAKRGPGQRPDGTPVGVRSGVVQFDVGDIGVQIDRDVARGLELTKICPAEALRLPAPDGEARLEVGALEEWTFDRMFAAAFDDGLNIGVRRQAENFFAPPDSSGRPRRTKSASHCAEPTHGRKSRAVRAACCGPPRDSTCLRNSGPAT